MESGLEAFVREEGDAAAERAESSWAAHPAGRIVIALTRGRPGAYVSRVPGCRQRCDPFLAR